MTAIVKTFDTLHLILMRKVSWSFGFSLFAKMYVCIMHYFEFIFFTFMLSARVSFITRFGLDLNKRRSRRSFGEQGRAGQAGAPCCQLPQI